MHAAPLTSPRLQRVLAVLRGGQPVSTRGIVRRARVMAVSACVAELRQHGAVIQCQVVTDERGRRHEYTLVAEPPTPGAAAEGRP